jgi:hypothetical protein
VLLVDEVDADSAVCAGRALAPIHPAIARTDAEARIPPVVERRLMS